MKEISQLLATAVGPDGKPAPGSSLEHVKALYGRAMGEFLDSPTGQELLRRGGPDISDRVIKICVERFGNTSPSQTPFYETLEQIGQDLLATLPPVTTPKVAPRPRAAAAATPTEIPAKVSQFAYMYNEQMSRTPIAGSVLGGCDSLRPKGGVVTLECNGHRYVYKYLDFQSLLEQAISHGLIR